MIKLFLDDERHPPADATIWRIARTVQQAITYMEENGCPPFISFDHDLGENQPTGFDLAKWMVERDLDSQGQFFADGFQYYVHSQNPVGVQNIKGLLDNYLAQR